MSNDLIYSHSINRLKEIVKELREKCPWDKKQTLQSLKSQTVEEVYELVESINNDDIDNLSEELGDLLLHIVFYCQIASENNKFSFSDVVYKICNKLVARHPHVYGSTVVTDEDEVLKNWENLKKKEGKTSILSGVPTALPAMNRAMAIQKKVSHVGFDWNDPLLMLEKVKEEILELEHEIKNGNEVGIQKELGDALFSLLNINRFYKFNEDDTLNLCNNKFIKRFQYIEEKLKEKGIEILNAQLDVMEDLWQEAKKYDN